MTQIWSFPKLVKGGFFSHSHAKEKWRAELNFYRYNGENNVKGSNNAQTRGKVESYRIVYACNISIVHHVLKEQGFSV